MTADLFSFRDPDGRRRVDLWYARPERCSAPELLAQYRQIVTDEEREQEQKFRFPGGREQYLITRALVRTVLSHYTGHDPAAWRFVAGRWGKPAVAAPPAAPLVFNLTHTAGLIVCGVTAEAELGVDAEDLQRQNDVRSLARKCLAADELAAFDAQPAEQQVDRFFRLWTLKEALLKAHGTGFSVAPERFSIRLEPGQPPRLIDPGPLQAILELEPQQWQLAEIQLGQYHRVAVAAGLTPQEQLAVRLQETIPLRWQSPAEHLPPRTACGWEVELA